MLSGIIQCVIMLSGNMPSVIKQCHVECHYAESNYSEYHYAESNYSEYHYAESSYPQCCMSSVIIISVILLSAWAPLKVLARYKHSSLPCQSITDVEKKFNVIVTRTRRALSLRSFVCSLQ